MADNRKEQERAELHRTIWAIADEMRGSVDGWDFKSYILGILFYRYISENISNYIDRGEWETGNKDFRYAAINDAIAESIREEMVRVKGFFILPSQLFENVCKVCDSDQNLNETLEQIFASIEKSAQGTESEDDFKGLFADLDVNSNKLGATVVRRNEKLVKLLRGVQQMKLGDYQDNTIDAFGDAYEYLMAMYASNAGKSGGEFFTPQEVSELLTRLAVLGKSEVNKVYDPACGSGSLLLKAAKILGKDNVRQGFFGQEINLTTYNLCRINMFLHDIDYDKFDIACEDTLLSPQHWDDEPFEVIVSNPPYSIKWKGDEDVTLINDPRFAPAGVLAPKSKADLAFVMHMLSWLAPNGTAAIVCFPGVMYRGGAEKKIRQYLVDNNYIDTIIQLPDNLFFGTSIATCIMVLKKAKKDNAVLFIDASRECVKITNSNKLTEENIAHIVECFAARRSSVILSASEESPERRPSVILSASEESPERRSFGLRPQDDRTNVILSASEESPERRSFGLRPQDDRTNVILSASEESPERRPSVILSASEESPERRPSVILSDSEESPERRPSVILSDSEESPGETKNTCPCRLVSNKEVAEGDYNLSVSTYVEQEDTREVIDIARLNADLREIVARENALRAEIDKIIEEIEGPQRF